METPEHIFNIIKEVFCLESILNFAKRIAEKIGIKSVIKAVKNKES